MLPSPKTRSLNSAVVLVPSRMAAMLMSVLCVKKTPLGLSPVLSPRAITKTVPLPALPM